MKTPPFLMAAALLFWGFETGFLPAAALMAILVEMPRWTRLRWEFGDKDFGRIWTFCSLILLTAAVLAFTSNQGPADLRGFLLNPNFRTQREAGLAGQKTLASVLSWLPMIYFAFLGAQVVSSRQGVPLETISLILQRRWKRARKLGLPTPASRMVDISPVYFGVCLFAAGLHPSEGAVYFWGLAGLLAWAFWPRRSRRFGVVLWAVSLAAALTLGYFGQAGISGLNRYLGNFNPVWLLNLGRRGFDHAQSKLMLGQVGRTKGSGSIVIRVQPKTGRMAPPLLREASYNTYHGQFWLSGFLEKDFDRLDPERDGIDDTSFALLPLKPKPQVATIACYLPGGKGLLPLPTGVCRLENLLTFYLCRNPLGAVLETGPGLVVFDAFYGPGATLDAPPAGGDTNVPPKEEEALAAVVRDLNLAGQPLDQAMLTLQHWFATQFAYSLWAERGAVTRTNETALGRFLLKTHRGHCEYFATATVLLLRELGYPARYAVGYAVNEASGSGYVVRQRDAHAWCLIWRHGTWEDFDTTPPSWFATESRRGSPVQIVWDFFSRLWFEVSKFRWGQSQARQYFLWALAPVLGVLLYQILTRVRRHRHQREAKSQPVDWPGLDSEFYALERLLASRGFARDASEPLAAWLHRAAEAAALDGIRPALGELLRLHYRYRFDPLGLPPAEREALRQQCLACLLQARTLVNAGKDPSK